MVSWCYCTENIHIGFGANMYQAMNTGQTGGTDEAPEHLDGIVLSGEVQFKHIGFRVNDPSAFRYNDTGESWSISSFYHTSTR